MSASEFAEWIAHYRKEPWGDFRVDLSGAQVTSMLANINRDSRRRQPFTIEDFMPFMERKPQPTPAQQLRASFIHLVKKAA